ncbi:molybdopterin oxidoreductase family protein [Alicyclobacillaceae bacterium I2511]|nr:molybdopterin oxidoreductase family protein [Alicyclobacillaceae bacterium I2511]
MMSLHIHRAVCPLDCPDACSLKVTVRDGKMISVTGDPDHPVTRGAICNKVRHMPQRVHHPHRVLTPLRRTGAKGQGHFQSIPWEDAYDEIVHHFHSVIKKYGAEAILPYSFYGNMGKLNAEGMDRRFFHRLGAARLDRTICSVAGSAGYKATMGDSIGTDPEDTVNAKLMVVWGANLASTNMHQLLYANQARKNGATIVHIDVHRNRTGHWADWFIPIRPGTDGVLALGLMHVLFAENLVQRDFLRQYTTGFEELEHFVQSAYPVAKVAAITGVPEQDIVRLAHLYGTTHPSLIRIGNGLQHHDNGGMTVRTISWLPALTGAWLHKGGGAMKGNGGYARLNHSALERPDLLPHPLPRTFNMNQLGSALLSSTPPPVKALFVYNSNPAISAPDVNKVRSGLQREDLFTVVHDLFITDTARYADLVLPATSSFENRDLYSSYWHLYLNLQEPILPPQGEAKSNFTLFKELAAHMGFAEDAFQVTEEDMIREALLTNNPYLQGITYEMLEERGWLKLQVPPFLEILKQGLLTPSGKIELFSSTLQSSDAKSQQVKSNEAESEDESFPLWFVPSVNHHFLNSTFGNVESLQVPEQQPALTMHVDDATVRGIHNHDIVRVWNQRGEIQLLVQVGQDVLPGVVVTQGLWWDDKFSGMQAVNQLTPQRLSDMGGGAAFFSTRVEVAPCS